jgi:glycosyltransferase involved in cell wall biosynthesis
MAEVVAHGETGLLLNPDDPVQLGDSIIQLLDNFELSQRMGRAGERALSVYFHAIKKLLIPSESSRISVDGS